MQLRRKRRGGKKRARRASRHARRRRVVVSHVHLVGKKSGRTYALVSPRLCTVAEMRSIARVLARAHREPIGARKKKRRLARHRRRR